ncbi:MAG TPA: cupredoxin domain-containing protein [Humisphaera sp.]
MNRLRLTILAPIALLLVAAAPAPRRVAVTIDNLKYAPQEVTVDVGDTVVWTNNDDREHTVTADDGAFSSGRVKPGQSFTWRANAPGRHQYGSDPFPRARGVVVVRGAK